MSKQDILARIKDSLHINPLDAQSPHYINPLNIEQKDELQAYIALQSANKAIVVESCPNTLVQDIHKALQEVKAQKILYNPNIADVLDINALCNINGASLADSITFFAYEKSIDETRGELFDMDTSIICADCGVANLGIIGIASRTNAPRLSSLITRNCIILLKKADIVAHFYDGVCALKAQSQNGVLPSNMIFIAGPSRTADIELQTVFGVHGSLKTYVIIY